MPDERSLLMPFSVRHFAEDDKLCHHMTFDVLQDLFPLALLEQVLTDCHAWEKRERALNMVTIVYLIIALTLFPRLTVAGVLRRLASGARFLWPDPRVALPTDSALCQRRQQLGVTPVRQLFRRCCRPQAPRGGGARSTAHGGAAGSGRFFPSPAAKPTAKRSPRRGGLGEPCLDQAGHAAARWELSGVLVAVVARDHLPHLRPGLALPW